MNFSVSLTFRAKYVLFFCLIAFTFSAGQDLPNIPYSAISDTLLIKDSTQTADSVSTPDSLVQTLKPIWRRKNFDFQLVNNAKLSFYLAAPEGWVLDKESGKNLGFAAVSYPQGWNLDYSPILMYANILNGKTSDENTFRDIISRQINQLKEYGANILADSIALTYDRKTCIVVRFYDGSAKVHNFISYINDRDNIVSLMLTSKDETKFEEAAPKFFDLINSYKSNTE
jgi:hypothetical protein